MDVYSKWYEMRCEGQQRTGEHVNRYRHWKGARAMPGERMKGEEYREIVEVGEGEVTRR